MPEHRRLRLRGSVHEAGFSLLAFHADAFSVMPEMQNPAHASGVETQTGK